MARCIGKLAPFLISTILTLTAKEQGVKNSGVLHGNAKASLHHPTDTPTAIRPPTDIQLVATCDHFIRASWKHRNSVDGFVVTLTEDVGHIQEKVTLPATQRHVVFNIDPYRQNYTFSIRSFLYGEGRRYFSEDVKRTVTSFGQAPDVEGFQAHVLTATSARTTWKTVHSEDIHISVCPATRAEDCVKYSTDGNLLVYVIHGLKPRTRYIVQASFSLELNGTVCKYEKSSRTITTPARAPPSLQARTISVTDTTATVVVERLSEQEFVRVTVGGEVLIYHGRIFTLRGLNPGRRYLLHIAACVAEDTCNAHTEMDLITSDAPARPSIEIVRGSNSSIAIRWAFPEAGNESVNYQVGYSGARHSFFDFTTDKCYEFTDLYPNSTYTIYVEAFNMEQDSVKIGSPSFVTTSTDTGKPQPPPHSPIPKVTNHPTWTAFSSNGQRLKATNGSSVTPFIRLHTLQPSTAFSTSGGGSKVTNRSSVTPFTRPDTVQPSSAFSTSGGGSKVINRSSVTPLARLDTVQQRSSGQSSSPLPVLSVLSILTTLFCYFGTFKT